MNNRPYHGVACVASVSVRFWSKERETKEQRGGGEERKEMLADKPLDFENRPLSMSCLSSRHLMLSSAVIIGQ